ncbi:MULTISPECIES: biotin transporter BioY [Okeania]|uniref:Biotin transporter n=1 Tax=Okeania hirsuta TaxID=1458930 RepID=A0A3N6RBJ3_9CYAN|nr:MULTISPECIES: biotin transporter BioY [Okeania]NEP04845.1 biotin transporter BioY [Okeania sp. SIO4D6]NEP71452.1 biotin transporter BioY [Okeania sp. SIO2G5]NEP96187.1 biotin transporter BioY [Okeania sp. SIO2F5]NEQ93956.1 biotin transporter BioY [Okeania sp. SIO2G4]NES79423.1 biotin transporter BioY [Okeania sp. SIO1H4]
MTITVQLLWAITGLLLTIAATFLPASFASPTWIWEQQEVKTFSLGVTYQVGAVLFVGCLGGKNAAVISQIAYILLGLTLLPVFSQGGGIGYLREPSFGYLLGFIPGAWICGNLAFQAYPKLESLTFSCLLGLLSIHATGLTYLIISSIFGWKKVESLSLFEAIYRYSIFPLPGQLGIICAVAVMAYFLRRLLFY